MTLEEASKYLKQLHGWNLIESSISRDFNFKNFKSALGFVVQVGGIAEEEGHHPDIFLYSWNKVRLTLSTHVIKGLSENDFILAAKINRMIE